MSVQMNDLSAAEAVRLMQPTDPISSPRNLLRSQLEAMLRAEHGVRGRVAAKRDSGYYAGRRAGCLVSAALTLHHLYGSNYEEAKHQLSNALDALVGTVDADLIDPPIQAAIVDTILRAVL